eukprot:TRINITY_DN656_c0_g1_i1.p1 TRINITY_DN656_c0_g1~~TRINITY_DN656_c0_g1_i1.p1  ORF type:complete len:483 (-),score=50.93 TRINITY_DN656_c0_g1_i1:28-1476(-)
MEDTQRAEEVPAIIGPTSAASPCRFFKASLIKDVAIGGLVVIIGIIMMLLSPAGSLLYLGGSDICVSATKTLLKKIPVLNPVVVLYPILITLSVITYFADASKASFNIFSGLLAKSWTKSLKNLVKGQPLADLCIGGLPTSLKRRLCPCVGTVSDEEVDDDDDDDDDDREWVPPSWKFQALIIGSLIGAASIAYLIPLLVLHQPTSIAAVYLVNAVAKTITVALRHYPILPAVVVGIMGAVAAAVCDYGMAGWLPIAVFPPSALFSWQIISDPFQLHLRGKLAKRPWWCSGDSNRPSSDDSPEQELGDTGMYSIETSPKSNEPSRLSKIVIIGTAGAAMLVSNIVQPTGGLFPQAMTGSFSAIFTKGVIGKPKKKEPSLPRLVRVAVRIVVYGAAVGIAYVLDLWIHTLFVTLLSTFNMILAFVLKMATSKEIKEVTRLEYDGLCDQIRGEVKYSRLNGEESAIEEDNSSLLTQDTELTKPT